MITEFVNGYNVTGNHATVGRDYHICNAEGRIVDRAPGKVLAMAAAAKMPPGDVPECLPAIPMTESEREAMLEAEVLPEAEPEAEPEPKSESEPEPEPPA